MLIAIVSSDYYAANVGDLLVDLSQIGDASVGYRARLLCKPQPRPTANTRRLAYFKKVLAGDTWTGWKATAYTAPS